MKNFLFLTLIFSGTVFAGSALDSRLQGYIEKFNLKSMTPPEALNKKMFLLGREFFFEKNLSGNNNISCADCHHPRTMTTDKLPLSLGEGASGIEISSGGRQQNNGKIIARNSPALFNLHNVSIMFWDGRIQIDQETGEFTTPAELPEGYAAVLKNALAAQALFPFADHKEMRGEKGTNEIANAKDEQEVWSLLFNRIIKNYHYRLTLTELFPGEELSLAHVARAIAHFEEQAFFAADTNYDRYLKGDLNAMSEIQKIGMDIFFGKGKCGECHRGEHLSDFSYQNIGIPQIGPGKMDGDDLGRFHQDPKNENLYAFKVPGLRNVSVTAPYMHDGAFKTLAQVIEHYDDIESSLNDYSFVNNYKNYFERIAGPLTQTNELKLLNLSERLPRNLFFEESEEKALAEFIRGALTERRFLDAEIDQNYKTLLRLQLTEEGFEKILKTLPCETKMLESKYFYFDVLTQEGYRLRELETPIKLFFVQKDDETVLNYRKQLFKTSGSVSGIVAGGTFEDEELVRLSLADSQQLSGLNQDFFNRLYTYHNPESDQDIPTMELEIMKNDTLKMNQLWHSINFKNLETISDEMNIPLKDLFFAPTSSNTKQEYHWSVLINGNVLNCNLQKSLLRTASGGITQTWSLEVKLDKVTKKDFPLLTQDWLKNLVETGLNSQDAQGTTPSPSKLTEKVLMNIFYE